MEESDGGRIMEKIVEQGLLYDFYGELLTAHQRQIYESVVYENLSLSEIAEEQGISRQGVHDIVKRCDKALMKYEEKLKLIARFQKMKEKIREMDDLTRRYEQNEADDKAAYCQKLRHLSAEILEAL